MLSPLALARLSLGLTALALGGCTIQTYSGGSSPPSSRASRARRPEPPPVAARPGATSQPRSPDATRPKGSARPRKPGVFFPGRRPGTSPGADQGAPTAPKITAPNAFGNGSAGRFRGLAYVIPEGTKTMPDFDELVPFSTLYTNSFDVAPQEFSSGFPGALAQNEWFGIRYEGNFKAATGGTYAFELTSDDGAVLYVDGRKVVDNDGVHGPKTAKGALSLSAGSHALRLDYFQAARGKVALELSMSVNGRTQPLVR